MYNDFYPSSRVTPGRAWYVKSGTHDRSGLSWTSPRITLQTAVTTASAGDTIYVAPGSYDESVTIPFAKSELVIVGIGPLGSVAIAPSTDHATALTCNANNCMFVNIDFASPDTTTSKAFVATGNGLRCFNCKFEGATTQVQFGPGSVAATDAETAGHGGDAKFVDCEFAWGTNGIMFVGSDYGAATQVVIENCLFHNLTAAALEESFSAGGVATLQFRNLLVKNCHFEPAEDGTEPTKYFSLNDSNSNSGVVSGCTFTVASNSGKNLVSTLVKWVNNFYPAGPSTGQPS